MAYEWRGFHLFRRLDGWDWWIDSGPAFWPVLLSVQPLAVSRIQSSGWRGVVGC